MPFEKTAPADVTEGGMAGDLPRTDHAFHVAPSKGDEFNTLRPSLIPTSCWRVDQNRFAFDSSFLAPSGRNEFRLLAQKRAPKATDQGLLAVFGHADATGEDDYNKKLSGRRAEAVYGVLVRDVSLWEKLYGDPQGGDRWGSSAIQTMLGALGFDPGKIDGDDGPRTRSAMKSFQAKAGFEPTGENDPNTRRELMKRYMDFLCRDDEDTPFHYEPADFLGKGEDASGKAAYQGCGEFNPVRVFSKKRVESWKPKEKHAERDIANRVNRRVIVYVFPRNVRFAVDKWPCPRASEGASACKKMFWQNGDARRKATDRNREYSQSHDTFACRFYESIARFSPCEGARRTMIVWLLGDDHKRLPGAPYRISGGALSAEGRADEMGRAHLDNVFVGKDCLLEWGDASTTPGETRYRHEMTLHLDFDEDAAEADDDREAAVRLRNLGYTAPSLAANIAQFQGDYGLEKKAWPDPATKQSLWQTHAAGGEGSRKPEEPAAGDVEPQMTPLPWTDPGVILSAEDEDPEEHLERLSEWHRLNHEQG